MAGVTEMYKMITAIASLMFLAVFGGAQAAPTKFRLCTGRPDLNYYKAGHILKKNSTDVQIDVIETKGSMANLDAVINGACDGAFVQADALLVYTDRNAQAISALERAGVLYTEQVFMLCNREAGVGQVHDLTGKQVVAVGPEGSGVRTTWDAFMLANRKRYGAVRIDPRDGVRALNAVADGQQVQCMITVAASNSSFIRNDAQLAGSRVVLTPTDDSDLEKVKDARGNPIYGTAEIAGGTYGQIQPAGHLYGTKAVGVTTVNALFVTNLSWVNNNEGANDKLLRAFNASGGEFRDLQGKR